MRIVHTTIMRTNASPSSGLKAAAWQGPPSSTSPPPPPASGLSDHESVHVTPARSELCRPPHITAERPRTAIEQQELLIDYQPLVDLQSGEITATEALVRWQHPHLGLLPPASFIPCAESCGQIASVGRWVLEHACRQRMAWTQLGVPLFPIMVNLSPTQLQDPAFADRVAATLDRTDMPANLLQLELTEGALLQATDAIELQLGKLRDLGINLVLDDFGMGHASLHYLRTFHFHKLKIPRELVVGIDTDERDAVIVKAVIDLGHKLGMGVIAEGIEALDQAAFLREQGCDEGQGYLFSRPIAPARLAELIAQDRSTRPVPIARTTSAAQQVQSNRL